MTAQEQIQAADKRLRVAVIGGGIAGLTAAYDLTRAQTSAGPDSPPSPDVTVFEGGAVLGGLAAGAFLSPSLHQ